MELFSISHWGFLEAVHLYGCLGGILAKIRIFRNDLSFEFLEDRAILMAATIYIYIPTYYNAAMQSPWFNPFVFTMMHDFFFPVYIRPPRCFLREGGVCTQVSRFSHKLVLPLLFLVILPDVWSKCVINWHLPNKNWEAH